MNLRVIKMLMTIEIAERIVGSDLNIAWPSFTLTWRFSRIAVYVLIVVRSAHVCYAESHTIHILQFNNFPSFTNGE